MKSPTIPEVEPQYEKEIDPFQAQVIKCETPTLSSRRRSSIFEETLTPYPSICRWLLDIISEDEHMVKESAHFVLSENQLVRVVAYTFDIPESQIQLNIEDEGCCGRFCSDSTQTLNEILIGNVNILKLDVEKVFYGSSKYNTIGLVQQVKDIENQINIINDEPAVDLSEYYTKSEVDGLISDAAIDDVDLSNYYNKTEADALLEDKLNISDQIDAYNKTEADEKFALKLNIIDQIDAYNRTEADALLDDKLNISDQIDAYNKTEADALLDDKLNISDQIDAYNKQEDDALLLLKADKIELIDAYSKTETDEKLALNQILLTKSMHIIKLKPMPSSTTNQTAAAFAKTGKNDALVLLAGGGDMLVSSLVSQPQLQEVRDIASGKSKGYVFATTDEMNTWMEDQENVAKLAIRDNLYIVDKQVMDYWWDGANLRALETELPDMSNVMTILGAATGGGNAITDLSFDGNTLTPAKNSSFVRTSYDENIGGQKTFTTTIHSVGISVQNYDNNSVVCAGGGVKAISDINASVDLTDYYNKSKIDEMINDANQLINDANELIRAVEDQIPPLATISNFVQKTGEDLDQTIQGRIRQQLDERVPFDSMSDNLYITKFDALEGLVTSETFNDQLLDKADKTELNNYMTLGTAQTINANKTFNNACRFTSTIDGMASITGASFIKSGADDTVVLLGAGGTKLISEFSSSVDDSNYVKKDGEVQQDIQGILRKTILEQPYPEPTDDDYITLGAVKSEFVSSIYSGSINGNLTANQFIKSGGTDQQILLANGTTKPLSDFSNSIDISNYVDKSTDQTIGGNKVFSLEVRAPTFKLPGYSSDYVVMSGAMKNKSHFVLTDEVDQIVAGTKIFSNNITAPAFIKSDGTNQQVLLANGTTKPLSEFAGGSVDDSNYVKKIGADVQVINGILRKGEDEGEESEDDDDYITKGVYNNTTNNIINSYCVRKTGQNSQNVSGRLLYINPFGFEDDDSQLLTNTTYPTWLEVSNAITAKFYNFYQVLTPPVMQSGFTASQS
ncbi:MAG: hypothetical protein EZS28_027737, partial [Streblomastix strix]